MPLQRNELKSIQRGNLIVYFTNTGKRKCGKQKGENLHEGQLQIGIVDALI